MFDLLLERLLRVRDEMKLGYIVVVIDPATIHTLDMKILQEGRWVQSKKKDWYLRVDPPNPQLNQQRHVHIARRKHIKTKDMQVAWNADGTRRDKVTFNQSIQGIEKAKRIAKDALGLGDEIILECAGAALQEQFVNESTINLVQTAPVSPVLLQAIV